MDSFVAEHRALLLKHARAYVRASGEKTSAKDVAQELELMLQQLGKKDPALEGAIQSADVFIRSILLSAARRAKRRRTLIDQIAAGDDLRAISEDLAALDADLPTPDTTISKEATDARELLEKVKAKLSPQNALVFALLIEDDADVEMVARFVSLAPSDVEAAYIKIMDATREAGIEGDPDTRGAR